MLTDTEIKRAIRECERGETVLNDINAGRGAGSLNLRIRAGASGKTCTWMAAWKQNGVRAFKPLGRYPAVSAAQARAIYNAEIAPQLLAGKDPRAAVAVTEKPTVGRLFEAYIVSMKAKGRASAPEVERMLLLAPYNAADALGRNRLAGTVGPEDVATYVAKFFRDGRRGAAHKARAYVSGAFGWATKATHDYTNNARQHWGVTVNPATAVQRDAMATSKRSRNLSAAELATLWDAASPRTRDMTLETASCIRLLILCGQRVLETLRIEGHEIDLDAAVWNMPAHKTKGKEFPHTIPLPPRAVDVLRRLKAQHGDGPLFPSRFGKADHIDHRSIQQVIDRWNVGIMPPFQTRDLRRTWKSRTEDAGIDRFTRDLIQQHARNDTGSLHYDRADYLPRMRVAMRKWSGWLSRNVTDRKNQSQDVAA
jgi:integrase